MPIEIDEVERKILQLEIERQALKREEDKASKERLAQLEREIENLRETSSGLKAHWQNEKESIQRIRSLKEKLESTKVEEQKAQREGDLNRAAELRYGTLTQLQKDLEEANRKLAELQKDQKMLKEEVDAEDVAEVVAKWTGIPVSKMLEGEIQKLLKMEDRLKLRVIGQDDAIHAVANAVRRARAGLQDQNRPIGSFIFLGPTGVGKTELCRALAEFLVRRRTSDGPPRYVGVHGKTFRVASDRRPSGLRRLRGGRLFNRSRAPPSLFSRACSTKSKKRILTFSTRFCRFSKTAA